MTHLFLFRSDQSRLIWQGNLTLYLKFGLHKIGGIFHVINYSSKEVNWMNNGLFRDDKTGL